ncbi:MULTISPECIES: hypothetical protein [Burkholderia]|nr:MULTISPECIES: hypothetical protein [Burkholderia]EIP89611.1 hypothetical protein A33K_13192 [Burkholderia humptydooensis MSMB43]
METPEQRSARRAMSSWLTELINDVEKPDGIEKRAIRARVLEALQEIDVRIAELNESLQAKFHVVQGRKLVKFYMKGGNAFKCIHEPEGTAATENGGGKSDWDTQVVIDPWAPVPLQAYVYGLLEELVTDTMIRAGVDIARVAGDFADQTIKQWIAQRDDPKSKHRIYSAYSLEYDDPQSLRQVFDQQRLGLWTNDRRRISDPDVDHPERIPGILLNDAIRPFILHRLGYTWHAQLPSLPPLLLSKLPVPQPTLLRGPLPAQIKTDVRKPLLMELIDVTLPRRDTIEAVAVWEELAQGQIDIQNTTIAVKSSGADSAEVGATGDSTEVKLPLPDIMYHLREIATMLCEIADGSSRHPDKLDRRFERFGQIWRSSDRSQIAHTLSEMAGVADINAAPPAHVASVTDAIEQHGGSLTQAILDDGDPAYCLARNLMDRIADGMAANHNDFTAGGHVPRELLIRFDEARVRLRQLIDRTVARLPNELAVGVLDAAFSDDLVLIRVLEQNEYVEPRQIGFSGVLMAVVIRVKNQLQLDTLCELFRTEFDPRYVDTRISTSVRFRTYSVPRATGITHEMTMVVFEKGKAIAYLTMTTATPGEAPFRRDAAYPDLEYASLPEIAAQRKVAAALIEDYLIRKTISQQYEALKTLLPVV